MPSIFDGTAEIVDAHARGHLSGNYGRSYSTWTFFDQFTAFAERDKDAATEMVSVIIADICERLVNLLSSLDTKWSARPGDRGVLRKRTSLSPDLLVALAKQQRLEGVIERSIIYVQDI